jgi:hypothetical protein
MHVGSLTLREEHILRVFVNRTLMTWTEEKAGESCIKGAP